MDLPDQRKVAHLARRRAVLPAAPRRVVLVVLPARRRAVLPADPRNAVPVVLQAPKRGVPPAVQNEGHQSERPLLSQAFHLDEGRWRDPLSIDVALQFNASLRI